MNSSLFPLSLRIEFSLEIPKTRNSCQWTSLGMCTRLGLESKLSNLPTAPRGRRESGFGVKNGLYHLPWELLWVVGSLASPQMPKINSSSNLIDFLADSALPLSSYVWVGDAESAHTLLNDAGRYLHTSLYGMLPLYKGHCVVSSQYWI